MGKRYYCDYCDRSFQDNMHNRKKHLNGVLHQRSKKAWFDHFRDAAVILAEEQTKRPCRKFLQTGVCPFGTNCKFSHMTSRDFDLLRQQIEVENQRRENPDEGRNPRKRSVEEWLARREKRKTALNSGSIVKDEEEATGSDAPPHFLSIPDLPPSLLPPPPGGWRNVMHTEWG